MTSISSVQTALVGVTALGAACAGGVFYAFSSFVMPALNRLPPGQAIAAMQSINVTAVRPPLMVVFIGTAALSVAVAIIGIRAHDTAYGRWLLAGAAIYLLGDLVLTIAFHVPRNDALAAVTPGSAGAAQAWTTYAREWTLGNHVRTVSGLAAAAAMVLALLRR